MDLAVQSTAAAIKKGNIKGEDIAAVSFTNMRSTYVPVDKDGNFLHNIFIWQDLRGVEMYPWMEERMAKSQYGLGQAVPDERLPEGRRVAVNQGLLV